MAKRLKVLELFSGTECISKEFRKHNHKTFTVDWDNKFDSDLHCDIEKLSVNTILKKFSVPDIIWCAPDCTTYSLMAISHHRVKNNKNGNLDPISDYAKKCDKVNKHMIYLIKQLQKLNPKLIFFIENPRACLQKMAFMQPFNKYKYLITYCKYQTDKPLKDRYMKPTNIWTNHPNPKFKKPCNYGDKCHAPSPRSAVSPLQKKKKIERSMYPELLCKHIVKICETIK